jgi:hypothetical protein
MTMGIRNKADLLLALLFASDSIPTESPTPVVGITRLEKLLFLLKIDEGFLNDVPSKDSFNFVPFKMGPWTNEVYDEVDFLESLGLLTKDSDEKRSEIDAVHDDELFNEMILDKYQKNTTFMNEQSETFMLTDSGKIKAKEIWNRLTNEEKNRLLNVKSKFNKLNLKQFLRYVYKKHPEYTTESEIKDYLKL